MNNSIRNDLKFVLSGKRSAAALRHLAAALALIALSACGGDNASHSVTQQPVKLAASLLPGLPAAVATSQAVPPKASLPSFTGHGWWWNPAEPGTGFAFEVQGAQAFVAFFMYDQATGAAVWYASFGAFNGTTFTGDLQTFKNGMPIAATTFKPAALDATQGPVTIVFSSAIAGQVTFPGGRVQNVERYNFVAPLAGEPAPVRLNKPEAGWWWNQDEPGRGYAIERQGNDVFLAMFHYTAAGGNTWNIINAKLDANTNTYDVALKSVTGGQSLTGTWRAATVGTDVGKLDIIFTTPCEATMRLPTGNYVNLRKYNFGGDDARCRADIATAAAPALPLLAQCFAIKPGVVTSLKDTPSISSARSDVGGLFFYDTLRRDSTYSSVLFQGRPLVQRRTVRNNLSVVVSPSVSTRLFEFTPTASAIINPGSRMTNGVAMQVNLSPSYSEDATLAPGATTRITAKTGQFTASGEPLTNNYLATFAALETLTIGQRSFPNTCRIDYVALSDTNRAGTLISPSSDGETGSAWFVPGYGLVKSETVFTHNDGRVPNVHSRSVTPIFVTP